MNRCIERDSHFAWLKTAKIKIEYSGKQRHNNPVFAKNGSILLQDSPCLNLQRYFETSPPIQVANV